MVSDIGYIIFVQIFGLYEYPGSPFTGNIVTDVVQMIFIPTVFIILFIYMTLGRLFAPDNKKMRILVGLAIYLFIITTPSLYRSFAYLAKDYFIIFLIIIPAIYFIFSHFGVRRQQAAAPPAAGGGGPMAMAAGAGSLAEELAQKKLHLQEMEAGLAEAKRLNDQRNIPFYIQTVAELRAETKRLEPAVMRDPTERGKYQWYKSKYKVH